MGKTTLMKSLIGMIPSCAGELEFAGTNITGLLSYQRVQHGIGFIPQGRMVFSTMTVEENIKRGFANPVRYRFLNTCMTISLC